MSTRGNSGLIALYNLTDLSVSKAPGDESALSTLAAVRELCLPSDQKRIKVDLLSLTLVSENSNLQSSASESTSSILKFVAELAASARATAVTHACSSVLAGHASESDEYGDVGLWIDAQMHPIKPADDPLKNARAVLIISVELAQDTKLPSVFKGSPEDDDVAYLAEVLAQLEHCFAFSVKLDNKATALHFLLGQMQGDDGCGWVGLLGVGTWSD
ncbi:hypothetical protein EW145_g1704 [Phellinidium pouzarii]|uniref:Uncharacterized protein n=1 Tax=Phellinidium pouzarii TaxID=167371 RepID=A0A4S4LDG9_9AGAM|nr:hypothetical protein EW145_g1704 [Phellinidium pouzarii]